MQDRKIYTAKCLFCGHVIRTQSTGSDKHEADYRKHYHKCMEHKRTLHPDRDKDMPSFTVSTKTIGVYTKEEIAWANSPVPRSVIASFQTINKQTQKG